MVLCKVSRLESTPSEPKSSLLVASWSPYVRDAPLIFDWLAASIASRYPCPLNCFLLFFIRLKMVLLTQFPNSNEKNILIDENIYK